MNRHLLCLLFDVLKMFLHNSKTSLSDLFKAIMIKIEDEIDLFAILLNDPNDARPMRRLGVSDTTYDIFGQVLDASKVFLSQWAQGQLRTEMDYSFGLKFTVVNFGAVPYVQDGDFCLSKLSRAEQLQRGSVHALLASIPRHTSEGVFRVSSMADAGKGTRPDPREQDPYLHQKSRQNTIKLDGIAETMQALEEGARLLVQQSQEPGTVGADLSKGLDLDSIVDGTESDRKGEGRPRGVSLPRGWKSKAIKKASKKASKTIITGAASQATKATKATNSTTANGNGVRAAVKRTRTGDDDGSDGGDVEEVDLPKKMQRGPKSKSGEGRGSRRQRSRSMDAPDQ
ncbi:hypothetical protein KI688_012413 [Linnemannia hyalina]|uniref:Uncharacterized protein n=1 Tax=Linnemannia hyalina TaxID=64524 RepID=A0A9P8BTV7_9FUNG|nr:hypothetical protein KI688_012413 [Linnemannia hyalina]